MSEKLKNLYRQMADHTVNECDNCLCPHSCCAPEHCEMTRQFALKEWGVTLKPTGHERLPFMGPDGCTVEPYLRPICTVHTCDINAVGFKKGKDGPDFEWTERYFEIRGKIEEMEFERSEQ